MVLSAALREEFKTTPYQGYYGSYGGWEQTTDEVLVTRYGSDYRYYDRLYNSHPHTRAVFQRAVLGAVGSEEWTLEPFSTDKQDVYLCDLIRENLDYLEWGRFLAQVFYGAFWHGFDLHQIYYDQDGKRTFITRLEPEPHNAVRWKRGVEDDKNFTWGNYQLYLRLDSDHAGVQVPQQKFFYIVEGGQGNPFGVGLASTARASIVLALEYPKLHAIFADRYASPIAWIEQVATYEGTLDPDALVDLINGLRQGSTSALPKGALLHYLETAQDGRVFVEGKDSANAELSKLIIGATQGVEVTSRTGTNATAITHTVAENNLAKSRFGLIREAVVKHIFRNIQITNDLMDAHLPFYSHPFPDNSQLVEAERHKLVADAIAVMTNAGFEPTQEFVDTQFGVGAYVKLKSPESESAAPDPLATESEDDQAAESDRPSLDDDTPLATETEDKVAADLAEAIDFALIARKIRWHGLVLCPQRLPGEVRFPEKRTARKLRAGYGYVEGHVDLDGRAMDCYLSPALLRGEETPPLVFAVKQITPSGDFDEHKLMLGYSSLAEAKQAYLQEMPAQFFGGIEAWTLADLVPYSRAAIEQQKLRLLAELQERVGTIYLPDDPHQMAVLARRDATLRREIGVSSINQENLSYCFSRAWNRGLTKGGLTAAKARVLSFWLGDTRENADADLWKRLRG